jgi:asparagine N-glycosylation enzyme membrane subunit Stt3
MGGNDFGPLSDELKHLLAFLLVKSLLDVFLGVSKDFEYVVRVVYLIITSAFPGCVFILSSSSGYFGYFPVVIQLWNPHFFDP